VPSLRREVSIARRGTTADQKIEDWALDLLNKSDPDEHGA
jgi:hypothetical protein